ncbi:hypothetical protein QQ045_023393 [Rhodiola kirilowii]
MPEEKSPTVNDTAKENGCIMTAAQFQNWKARKDADASARKAEAARKRAEDLAAGYAVATTSNHQYASKSGIENIFNL